MKRGVRSWLTMIGIFIGVAAVVALIGLGQGLQDAIGAQFGFLGTDVLSVQASGLNFAGPPGTGSPNPLSNKLADKIAKIDGVDAAFNRYIASGKVEFNNIEKIQFVGSVPSGTDRKTLELMLNLKTAEGRLLKEGDGRKVTVGNGFSKDDNAFSKAIHVGDRISINGIVFEVVGVLESKGSFIIDNTILMNEDTLLKDIRPDDGTTNVIAIKVKDVNTIGQVQDNIEKLMRKERHVKVGEEDFVVESPQAVLDTLNNALFAVRLFVVIIAAISLLVGGIGIMNTMYTAVVERTKEIGIMKAIGATNSAIFSIFFIESGLLGSVGGAVGVLIGLALSYGFAFVGSLALGSDLIRANVSITLIFGALAFSFVIGTVFGSLPAYQASKLKPVESLRKVI